MSASPPKGSLTARLLASAALILVSGGYVLWQPPRDNGAKPLLKLVPPPKPVAVAPVRAPDVRVAEAPRQAPPPAPVAAPPRVARAEPEPAPAPYVPTPQPREPQKAWEPGAEQPKLIMPVYADGDYTGEPVDSDFGPVQVEVTVEGGKLTAIKFLEIPDHRQRSAEISEAAIPILVQEAIQAQGPRIDVISQATYTTITFANALYNALSKAEK